MVRCHPPCPPVIPRRPTAPFLSRRWQPWGSGRSGSTCTCRSARCGVATATSTPTRPPSSGDGPGASRATYAEAAITEIRQARRVLGDIDLPVETVFFGGGTPTLLSSGDLVRCWRRSPASSGWRRASRSRPRPTRTASRCRISSGCATSGFNRISFGMQSAVPHVLAHPRPHPRPAAGPRGGAVGPAGRLRAGQPRSDLRHTRGESRRLEGVAGRRPRLRARPRQRVLADRRGRHRPGPSGTARRGRDARRRRSG